MEQELGSGSSASKFEGSSGGGSTSSSDRRGGDRDLEDSQDPRTTSDQVERARVTENPNRVDDIAGLQTTGAHEDSDHSEDLDSDEDVDHTSEQGGGSLAPNEENVSSEDLSFKTNDSTEGTVTGPSDEKDIPAVSTGNADNEQTPNGWTIGKGEVCGQMEKSDAGTVGKGEVSRQMETSDAGTVGKGEVCRQMEKNTGIIIKVQQQITEVQNSLHSDDTKRAKSLKKGPVVAKIGESEGDFAADNERKDVQAIKADAQAPTEGSCEASVASSQGLQSSPVAEAFAASEPDLVVSKTQGGEMLGQSRSVKMQNLSKPPETLRPSKSWRDTPNCSKSPRERITYSNSPKETSMSEEPPSAVLISGTQKETNITSEAPSTASTPEAQEEVDTSQEDPSAVSAPAAQEESSEISEAPSTAIISETQKEVGLSLEHPSTVSRHESLKEVFTSPEATCEVSEGSGVVLEAPRSVPTSGALIVGISQEALSMVSDSVVQKDVDSISEAFSTPSTSEAQEEVSVNTEASRMVSNSEVPKDVGISSDSPNTVRTLEAQEEIRKSLKSSNMVPNSEVQNEVSISADAPSRVCEAEGEIGVVSEAPSTASTSEAQKGFGTSSEEITPRAEVPSRGSAPEGLQRKVSEIDEEKLRNYLEKSPQQSETTVSDVREGLLQARSEGGKETSVLEGNVRESDCFLISTLALHHVEQLAQKDKIIADLDKKANEMCALSNIFKGRFRGLEQDYDKLYSNFEELGGKNAELDRKVAELDRKNAELLRNYQDLKRAYREKEKECADHSARAQSYANSYGRLQNSLSREKNEKEKLVRELRGQLEQMKKECGTLQDQMSLYEQQHANEQSRGGSYLDDTKAATPALLVSALNGVKDASNNFVKVLKNSIQPGFDTDQLEKYIGAVSRNGHTKFQYQAYVCRILFGDFDLPYAGSSKVVLPPTTYFRQYQNHDLKKTDTVERLLRYDPEIDASLHEFCFDKFLKLIVDIQDLTDGSIDLKQQVQNKQHPRDSKLYISFCKLAVSVWLLQRLAFSFLHPAKPFIAQRGAPFDMNRMQSVVPLDEPSSDEEVQQRVGFYVLPGFDIGNSAIPCEVYVALK